MRFYVYELVHEGECLYIGKGSGHRLKNQISVFGVQGRELAFFKREKDAYAFERDMIAQRQPLLNRHPGGNGKRAVKKRAPHRTKEEILIQKIGTRAYTARLLLRLHRYLEPEILPDLISVAKTGFTQAEISAGRAMA